MLVRSRSRSLGDSCLKPFPLNQEIARSLASEIAQEQRLAFARSFTCGVIAICRRARNVASIRHPDNVELIPLSSEASALAAALGTTAASLAPERAAYLIGTIYTATLPESYRSAHGIFYTPPELVERLLLMAEEAGISWDNCRVLDPACGGGAFLVPVARRLLATLEGAEPVFKLQQLGARLRGFDVDPFGAWLAQATLEIALQDVAEKSGRLIPLMVEMRDSLDLKPEESNDYDLVIGNPPYGRVSLDAKRREIFSRSIYGHANLYGLFTDAALRWTRSTGVIAYVTPTSMLSGLYYKELRRVLASEAPPLAVNFVTQRAGVFDDVLQETMLAAYRKGGPAVAGKVGFIDFDPEGRARQKNAGLFSLPMRVHAPWLLPRVPAQAALTRRLRSMPYRLADYGYGVSTGPLVWNRHKVQFQAGPGAGSFPVIWAESVTSDGRFLWRSEKRNHAPWFLAQRPKDDWLIVTQPCVLLQRTTAKEQARRLIAAELPESFIRRHRGVVVENHLNMVRAVTEQPAMPPSVIAALLNSAAVDTAFRCINGSVAVSAFEIEELPIPHPSVITRLAQLVAANAPRAKIEAVIATAYGGSNATAAA
jgi:adenine-specific DNA-methyltransferase